MPDLLFERDAELAALAGAVSRAGAGDGGVVVVEGPAGIGKSRLLAAAGAALPDGVTALRARASELERSLPFGVVRQLLEPLASTERERVLAGTAAPAASVFDAPFSPPEGPPGDPSFAVLNGLFWAVLNLAEEGPVVLAVDDLHWCDRPSLRFLSYLVRRVEGLPVLLAATLRTREPGVDAGLLAELLDGPATEVIPLPPLSADAVTAFARSALAREPDAAFAAACHAATGGNPLLVAQLLETLRGEQVEPVAAAREAVVALAPQAVARTVAARLAALPPAATALAQAAAVLGDGGDLLTAAALGELSEQEALAAHAALVRAELLAADRPLAFAHPLLRDAVYGALPLVERARRHLAAAETLRDAGAATDRVATQLLRTAPADRAWVVETLLAAADAALRSGAPDGAIPALRRALAEPPPPPLRAAVLGALGVAEAITNGLPAIEPLRAALELAANPVEQAAVASLLARVLLFTGSPAEAAALAERSAAQLPAEAADLRDGLRALSGLTLFFGNADRELARPFEELRGRRAPVTLGEKLLAGATASIWAWSGGPLEDCAALAQATLAGGEVLAADPALITVTATIVLALAERVEALDAWELAHADCHRQGSDLGVSGIRLWHGMTLMLRGDLGEAERTLRQALADFAHWDYGAEQRAFLDAFLGRTLIERGELSAAAQLLAERGDPGTSGTGARLLLSTRLALEVASGRDDAALGTAQELRARAPWIAATPSALPWRSTLAVALRRLGREQEAREAVAEELVAARVAGSRGGIGRALRVQGELDGASGLATLEEAVATLASSPARAEHARALAALGAARLAAGELPAARTVLTDAAALASECAASGLQREVAELLRRAGARASELGARGVAALTPSERRVVDRAASGATNRVIAQQLYVTPKTVEVHLTSAFRKLGVRSRRELERALAREGATVAS